MDLPPRKSSTILQSFLLGLSRKEGTRQALDILYFHSQLFSSTVVRAGFGLCQRISESGA